MKQLIIENLLPVSVYVKFEGEKMDDGKRNPNILWASLYFNQPESANPDLKIREMKTGQQYSFELPNDLEQIRVNIKEILQSANCESGEDEDTLFIWLASLRTGKN